MDIPAILQNKALREEAFPVTKDNVYLAHAGVCPLPRRVLEAIERYGRAAIAMDQENVVDPLLLGGIRERVAQMINATPREIALVGPTSLALSLVASGLEWQEGDRVLVYQDDYPSNVYPWMALSRKGVRVDFITTERLGEITLDSVLRQVDAQTRLVALASCHFCSGYRIDHAAIGQALRERGVLFCLDAIQTLGAFPTTVEFVDFMAADAHKWLLGPCAAGVLYIRESLIERLHPMAQGWNNILCPDFVAQDDLVYRKGGRRYEAGSHNFFGLLGLRAALELIAELGIDGISKELSRKRAWLIPALERKGYTVLGSGDPAKHAGGIISFRRPGEDMAKLHGRLQEKCVITSLRADRSGLQYLRLSPHFYNTDEELSRALDLL